MNKDIGWECPRCHSTYAPSQVFCWNCQSETPDAVYFMTPGDMNLTPNQLREMQDALRAVSEDISWNHNIIVLPPGASIVSEKNV